MARVLIIDDDPQTCEMMRQMLERVDHEVRIAADGAAGLSLLRQEPTDLAIVDLFMPRRDGLEVIVHLRQEQPELPVIAISGGLSPDDPARLTRRMLDVAKDSFGAARVLRKPIRWHELVETVAELVGDSTPP